MDAALVGGLGLITLVVTTAVWFRRATRVSLVGSRVPYVVGWAASALLGALAFTGSPGWIGGIAAASSLVGGGVLLLLIAVSPQRAAADALRVGERLREFTAPDDDAQPFTLSGLEGRPILLKFFRGHW